MEGFVFVPAARHETALSTFDVSKGAEPIEFDFVQPVGWSNGCGRCAERIGSSEGSTLKLYVGKEMDTVSKQW